MTFQSSVSFDQGFGVVGEIFLDGPMRAQPLILDSTDPADNVIGRYFTIDATTGKAEAGGTGAIGGILANPKAYSSNGTVADGPLAPTLVLPNETVAEFLTMGEVIVSLAADADIGDLVLYDTTDGSLSVAAPVATFTASQSTTTLTVSAITAGTLGVGSVVKQASGNLSTIIALLTGTGGAGTYTVDTSQTVSSGAATATSVAPSGKAFVPNATITRYNTTGASLAVAKLTN